MFVAALLRLIEAPILTIDEEVIVAAARMELPHVALRVAREHFVDEGVRIAGFVGPGEVLRAAQVELVVFARLLVRLAREDIVLERAHAVGAAEEESERMLRVVGVAAVRPTDAQTRRDGEAVGRVERVDLLEHRLALPFLAASGRVDVDAGRAVEEVRRINYERNRRD